MKIKYDKILDKIRERDDYGITCFLSDASGNLLGEFKNGILIGDANPFLLTQAGEQLLTQAGEELIYN